MKKLLLVILVLCCMTGGCTYKSDVSEENSEKKPDRIKVARMSSDDYNTYINRDYGFEMTVDEHLALEIWNAVIARLYSQAMIDSTDYTLYEVKEENIYVLSRYVKGTLGGDINVAISKENGAIVKIWGGE